LYSVSSTTWFFSPVMYRKGPTLYKYIWCKRPHCTTKNHTDILSRAIISYNICRRVHILKRQTITNIFSQMTLPKN
jgi:hypothetical protein